MQNAMQSQCLSYGLNVEPLSGCRTQSNANVILTGQKMGHCSATERRVWMIPSWSEKALLTFVWSHRGLPIEQGAPTPVVMAEVRRGGVSWTGLRCNRGHGQERMGLGGKGVLDKRGWHGTSLGLGLGLEPLYTPG